MQKSYAQVGVEDWFRVCLPRSVCKPISGSKTRADTFRRIADLKNAFDPTGTEDKMYAPLCETIHALLLKTNTDFQIKETADTKEKKSRQVDTKPDLCLFDASDADAKHCFTYEDNTKNTQGATKKWLGGRREHFVGTVAWSWVASFIEAKTDLQWSPFEITGSEDTGDFGNGINDAPIPLEDISVTSPVQAETPSARRARSQIIKYVSEIQLRQHRTFVLCAHICQRWIRFMRWDRTGAIVSKAVDYIKNPLVLAEFVCRLATANASGQGYDTSMRKLDESTARKDLVAFCKKVQDVEGEKWQVPYVKDMLDDSRAFPIYEIICPGMDGPGIVDEPRALTLWVGRYFDGSRSPTGRGSKAYIAYDCTNERLVFLKDYWCARHPAIHPELEVYKIFREKGVKFVATALGGGVVLGPQNEEQVTLTQRLLKKIWINVSPERFHYRLVLLEVGRPLETYTDSAMLITVVYRALLGHEQAWVKAGVLHRDISPGNIVITQSGDGLLVDWDLCKLKGEIGQEATQHGRSGTWPFMSALLLAYPRKPNTLSDDLESFVYVLCFMAERFHLHDLSARTASGDSIDQAKNSQNRQLAQHVKDFFFAAIPKGEFTVGGDAKQQRISAGSPSFRLSDQNSPLAILIDQLYGLLHMQNKFVDWRKAEREWAATLASIPNAPTQSIKPILKGIQHLKLEADVTRRPLPPPSQYPQPKEKDVQGKPPLDDHAAIIAVFGDIGGWQEDVPDKTSWDQFANLPDPDELMSAAHRLVGEDTISSSSRDKSRGASFHGDGDVL